VEYVPGAQFWQPVDTPDPVEYMPGAQRVQLERLKKPVPVP
jgi:hypothetical protein